MARRPRKKNKSSKPTPMDRPSPRKPINWKTPAIVVGVLAFAVAMHLVQPEKSSNMRHAPAGPAMISLTPPESVPERHQAGMKTFQANCAQCHGQWANGSDNGPTLVHDYYKPSHHADVAFYRAAQFGVRAHHWTFGDMPSIPGVTRDDMDQIIPFLRWWQRENGIKG